MTSTGGADSVRVDGAVGAADGTPRPLPFWLIPGFVAIAVAIALVNIGTDSDALRVIVFDSIGLVAAGMAVYGVHHNRPSARSGWWLVVTGLALFVLGDIVYDTLVVGFGHGSGYPYADLIVISAYPCFAIGLWRLSVTRFRRDAAIDGAIVTVALAAVIWQWVVTPVLNSGGGATVERMLAVLYPVMDVLLVIALVHAVFTVGRWRPAAWFLFASLVLMLVSDTVYARLVADGTSANSPVLDAMWPIAYVLLAAAALHPSMRKLWDSEPAAFNGHGHARVALLGAALFAAPAVVIIDNSHRVEAITLAAISGAAAMLVAWRIARLVADANRAHDTLSESEARFRALVQYATDIVAVIAYGGEILYASPSVIDILGSPPGAVVGTNAYDLVHPDDVVVVDSTIDRLLDDPVHAVTFEFRIRNLDNTYRWVQATCTNQIAEPAIGGIVGNFRNIDDRKRADAFSASETLGLEMMLAGRPLPHTMRILLQATEDYVSAARASIRLVEDGHDTLRTLAAPSLPEEFIRALDRLAPDPGAHANPETRIGSIEVRDLTAVRPTALRDVSRRYGLRTVWSLPVSAPEESRIMGVLELYLGDDRRPTDMQRAVLERTRDLIALTVDRAAQTRQLGYLALHDTLTSLPNRALVVDRLEHALARLADRHATLALLFIDLDHFKVVNDGLGHDTGDELLVAVGRRLSTTVRRQDTVARLGGDEFVVVCEDLTDEHQAEELAARTVEALSMPFGLSRAEVTVTPSVGIAATRRSTDTPLSLLRDADAAMYRAKRRGGARFELFDEAMHTQAVTRLLTERALRNALTNDELRVVFQRQFDLVSGAAIAEEVLLRWIHPARGVVPPAEFVPVAEETGMIVPIGRWAFEQACARAARTATQGTPLNVSVNLSARSLLRPDLPEFVARCVHQHGVAPGRVSLEIPELALLDDFEMTAGALRALKAIGVHLAIDDFGTGGSSLTYLRQFPFDELKIDCSFVAGLGQSAADDAIVAATINMAHALGIAVSAEGVETELQKRALIDLGCDRAQGYLLAEPQPETFIAPELTLPGPEQARHLFLVREEPA
jgi:diguanylate cyclase (GGDEF)-like protein/PAS domain S-box-containing protein